MKTVVMFLLTLTAAAAFAQADMAPTSQPPIPPPQPPHTIWIQGIGSSFGMCDGAGNTYFCVNDLKQRAEQDGQMDMQNRCYMQGGQLGFGNCDSYCTPNYIPPGSPTQMVNCHANCSAPCQVH
jgi:hypothetical protein